MKQIRDYFEIKENPCAYQSLLSMNYKFDYKNKVENPYDKKGYQHNNPPQNQKLRNASNDLYRYDQNQKRVNNVTLMSMLSKLSALKQNIDKDDSIA